MSTINTIQSYYESLRQKKGWESFLFVDMIFVNNGKQIQGKNNCLEGIRRFYLMMQSLDIQELLVDGEKACPVVRYHLKRPEGNAFNSDVAEIFHVKDDKIRSFAIYFDSEPYSAQK